LEEIERELEEIKSTPEPDVPEEARASEPEPATPVAEAQEEKKLTRPRALSHSSMPPEDQEQEFKKFVQKKNILDDYEISDTKMYVTVSQ
jgi:hypothetical protein